MGLHNKNIFLLLLLLLLVLNLKVALYYKVELNTEDSKLKLQNKIFVHAAFDPRKITHVYHLGGSPAFGRSNNQIISIFHAVDKMLDEQGDQANDHHTTGVVALSGWAFGNLQSIFHNGGNSSEFALHLEQFRPTWLVHADRLEALGLTESHNKTNVQLSASEAYYYRWDNIQKVVTPQLIEKRRHILWGQLFQRGAADRNLVLYNSVRESMESKWESQGWDKNYVTIHSRWLEGECEQRVGNHLPKDECHMTPSYIKQIMGGSIDKPIVFIGDGQNQKVLKNLKADKEIGPALVVPPNGPEVPQPWSDMMIAIMGDVFIGTRVSSFAVVIGLSRVIRGEDPKSNYIYTGGYDPSIDEKQNVTVCESCLFLCNQSLSHLCGSRVISI